MGITISLVYIFIGINYIERRNEALDLISICFHSVKYAREKMLFIESAKTTERAQYKKIVTTSSQIRYFNWKI